MLRIRTTLSMVAGCLLLGVGTQAKAVVIDPTLTVGDAYYLGHIVNGAPSSEAAEAAYINFLNTLAIGDGPDPGPLGNDFDRIGSTVVGPFPEATAVGAVTDNSAVNTINTGALVYFYVYAKYGGDAHVWFFMDGVMGEIAVPANNPDGQGISHLAMFNPTDDCCTRQVPEPTSLTLLGGALIGMAAFRRRRRFSS